MEREERAVVRRANRRSMTRIAESAPLGSGAIDSKSRTAGHSVSFHRWATTGTNAGIRSVGVWPLISSPNFAELRRTSLAPAASGLRGACRTAVAPEYLMCWMTGNAARGNSSTSDAEARNPPNGQATADRPVKRSTLAQ